MGSGELKLMAFDTASWTSFLWLIMGVRSFAAMTLHLSSGERLRAKVILIHAAEPDMTFATID